MERQKAELAKENAELKEEAAKLRAELQQSLENVKALSTYAQIFNYAEVKVV